MAGEEGIALAKHEYKSLRTPDEVRKFEKGKVELVNIGGGTVGRFIAEPGWRWSKHVKPIAGTEWCQAPHFQYMISGTLHIKMADGSEFDLGPGDTALIPPGHDGWVVGEEPVVAIDWSGLGDYAKRQTRPV